MNDIDFTDFLGKIQVAVGGPLFNLQYTQGTNINIFHDMKFHQAGVITQWRFYAGRAGGIYVAIYRPQLRQSDGVEVFTVVGVNYIESDNMGLFVSTLSSVKTWKMGFLRRTSQAPTNKCKYIRFLPLKLRRFPC